MAEFRKAFDFMMQQPVFFTGRTEELDRLKEIYSKPIQDQVVVITGPPGIGKSALARQFAKTQTGEVHFINSSIAKNITDLGVLIVGMKVPQAGDITIIDDIGNFKDPIQALKFINQYRGDGMLIATSNTAIYGFQNIPLGALKPVDVFNIWSSNLFEIDQESEDAQFLYGTSKSSPRLAILLGRLIRDGILKIADVHQYLKSFAASGLVDPYGKPISSKDDLPDLIKNDICIVDSHLLQHLKQFPENMYDLSPRKFEELVAEIMNKLGYTTELTQTTRDGGKDIYAAKKDSIGTFLYIVECKKYAPDNHVGVGVIRQLYGVVQAEHANAGIVATTSYFSKDAKAFQESISYQVSLQDYFDLQRWISDALKFKST